MKKLHQKNYQRSSRNEIFFISLDRISKSHQRFSCKDFKQDTFHRRHVIEQNGTQQSDTKQSKMSSSLTVLMGVVLMIVVAAFKFNFFTNLLRSLLSSYRERNLMFLRSIKSNENLDRKKFLRSFVNSQTRSKLLRKYLASIFKISPRDSHSC